ncbi:Aspartate aminotransferase, mitochondrial, partial [Trichinella spiralis]
LRSHKLIMLSSLCRIVTKRSVSSWFHDVPLGPPDAILGLTEAYNKDTNPNKINLGAGAYRDDDGKPYVLPSVRKAEKILFDQNLDKEYAGIAGIGKFNEAAVNLAFGDGHPVLVQRKNATVQGVSGTGSLRIAAAFLEKFHCGPKVVWASTPTWVINISHMNVTPCVRVSLFRHSGLEMKQYRYYDKVTNGIDEAGMLDDMKRMPCGSIVLLHACAHNPTGVDPSPEQWQKISNIVKEKELFPLFDMAYQGFATGDIDRDAFAVRLFLKNGHKLALAQSFSKNMGLYGERVGALTFITENEEEASRVLSQLKILIRPMISNPPIHGARIAHLLLTDPVLRNEWLSDLKVMTSRIIKCRKTLAELLEKHGSKRQWKHIVQQTGMFCYSGLNETQVRRLIEEFSIYLTKDGRISIAGISSKNIQYLANAIHVVTV